MISTGTGFVDKQLFLPTIVLVNKRRINAVALSRMRVSETVKTWLLEVQAVKFLMGICQ